MLSDLVCSSDLEVAVETERKAREETEEAILEMLRDMVTKVKFEIDSERTDRETNHRTLLSLLHETSSKFDNR